MRWGGVLKGVWGLVLIAIAVITACTAREYQGSAGIYLLFTVLSTAVLLSGFGRGAIFFDAFIGVLLWVGFWLKFSIRTAFFDGAFAISVGGFDGSPASADQALQVTSVALAAILLARFLRARFWFSYPQTLPSIGYVGIFAFYRKYRLVLMLAFIIFVLAVCISNALLGIYQRGLVAQTNLPFRLNGVYTWLLLFGMASVSALILRFEFEINRDRYWIAVTIALLEVALSNISMWSRGMILNGASLLYGAISLFRRDEPRLRPALTTFVMVVFVALFAASVLSVNWLRANTYPGYTKTAIQDAILRDTSSLFLDRWVGIEGVMSVVGASHTGWEVFKEALHERFDTSSNAFYDQHFVVSVYDNARDDKAHFVSLPGYIAFLFYPGSFIFLFGAVFAFSIVAALFEYFVYRIGGKNMVFCALIAQVIAFRYTSFGYVPLQSYMLFGSILLNVFLLYFLDKWLCFFCKP